MSRNNTARQQQSRRTEVSTAPRKVDKFIDWMSSCSIEHSLWSSKMYHDSLLAYIGRIYGQRVHMFRIFMQIKNDTEKFNKFDELDILNELIQKTKQRLGNYRI
jgi:hypothetical protein